MIAPRNFFYSFDAMTRLYDIQDGGRIPNLIGKVAIFPFLTIVTLIYFILC